MGRVWIVTAVLAVLIASRPALGAELSYLPPAAGVKGAHVTVAVPGLASSDGRIPTVSGPVGAVRPAPPDGIRHHVITFENFRVTQDNLLWANAYFPRLIGYFLITKDDYVYFSVGESALNFKDTESYLPRGSCIYAIDGYQFTTNGTRNHQHAASIIFSYLYSRPRTDYVYLEYFATRATAPCSEEAPRRAVIMPMAQWTATHRAWQTRQLAVQQDRARQLRLALGGLFVGAIASAMTAPRPAPSESIWLGKGGCPMFTERHYDGSCW